MTRAHGVEELEKDNSHKWAVIIPHRFEIALVFLQIISFLPQYLETAHSMREALCLMLPFTHWTTKGNINLTLYPKPSQPPPLATA